MDCQTSTPPRLSDGVVLLDAYRVEDVRTHLDGEDEEHARRFGLWPARSTTETVTARILRQQEEWCSGASRRGFAVREAASGVLVGGCEIRLKEGRRGEMSWWIFPAWRRRGLATRAARLACDYAWGELGVVRVDAYVEPDNLASRGVARSAGFTEQAVLPEHGLFGDERRDMVWYSRLVPPSGEEESMSGNGPDR